ncbi:MAG: sulfatase [Polyangiales bacterium]
MKRALFRFLVASLFAVAFLYAEGSRVLAAAGAEIAGAWETFLLAREVPSIAAVALFPLIAVVVAYAAMVPLLEHRRGRIGWGFAMAMIAAALAVELSTGRKARMLAVRVPFVIGLAVIAFVLAASVAPRARAWAKGKPWAELLLGGVLILAALVADERILPRLYPVFHTSLIAVFAIGLVTCADAVIEQLEPHKLGRFVLIGLAALGLAQIGITARRVQAAGKGLAKYDNARRIADERSLILSRAAALAAKRWPPPTLDEGDEAADPLASTTARAIQATGRDLLLVTIDALRADHLGAYDPSKKTSPEIDHLATEGVVFEHAYTPTPHTSYAVTSLMTGKYMRPILALEAASEGGRRPDETWAGLFRIYGFRTAAFFPPAVWAVDGDRFAALRARKLDFEHFKIEFASPDLIDAQLGGYLATAPKDKPLFVWVHLFEPHEPYVAHPEHPFGDGDIERYDSEIAAADEGVGKMVRRFRAARPGAIVMLSADHGEAFGEHGARYHGTTVYEEQVHVPLIVSAPGLLPPRRESQPVQLVDLLPTALSMYGIPRPPRVRGRDLGPVLLGKSQDQGIAFAEVEDSAMIARGNDRLVCNKKLATCALYDVSTDPTELTPINDAAKITSLKRDMKGLVSASAALEGFQGAQGWPDALRRAFAGDTSAASEVASLLDDVDVAFRRRAAEALARLAQPDTEPSIRRAWTTEQDLETKRWIAIAHVRTAKTPPGVALATVGKAISGTGSMAQWASLAAGEARMRAGLSVGPNAEARAFGVLVEWLPRASADGDLGRAILAVLPVLHEKNKPAPHAVEAILPLLGDIRLRVAAADALGALGDPSAIKPLIAQLETERHHDARVPEARALAKIGAQDKAMAFLARFLGVPNPPPGAADALLAIAKTDSPPWMAVAHDGRALPIIGKSKGGYRLIVWGAKSAKVAGVPVSLFHSDVGTTAELEHLPPGPVVVEAPGATFAAIVPQVDDLPPPKPPRTIGDPDEP